MSVKKKCSQLYCRKNRGKGSSLCYHHKYLREKNKDLYKWSYDTHRRNAKRRGKCFTLTFDQFKQFCIKTLLLTKGGRTKESYSINRKDQTRGYTLDNIEVKTISENSKLNKKILKFDYLYPDSTIVHKINTTELDEDCPF